ncbi:MAG: hypothetical protein JSU66_03825 [Deltaproteobacteria bacterium]|nr:MAG: hypothetical protein JSU66_03825 [Deltaproteobacteria bacterium]
MRRITAYRALCGLLGIPLILLGVGLVLGFFRAMAPGGEPPGPLVPLGPNGLYYMAFLGTALVGWGGGLVGAMRQPETSRSVGTATAVALVLSAGYRMLAWFLGDYYFLGEILRVEAAILLLLALAFVWLRPPKPATAS